MTKDMAAKLNSFATSCYRIMVNIKCLDNSQITESTISIGISPQLSCHLTSAQVPWHDHVLCMEKDGPANILLCMSSHPPIDKDSQGDCISPFPAKSRNGLTPIFLRHGAHCPRPSQLETTFNRLLFGGLTIMSHTWISWSISALDLNGHPLVILTSKNFK